MYKYVRYHRHRNKRGQEETTVLGYDYLERDGYHEPTPIGRIVEDGDTVCPFAFYKGDSDIPMMKFRRKDTLKTFLRRTYSHDTYGNAGLDAE